MEKIRIGNDINVIWLFKYDDLTDLDLCIEITNPKGDKTIINDIRIESGNIALFTIKGKDYNIVGDYNLTIWKNKGKDGQTCYDKTKAFSLVNYSCCCDELKPVDLYIVC